LPKRQFALSPGPFMASEQGGFISGTAINVDGGKSPVV
jgi:hypothetical protein